ncbi:MAG: 1-acyl-sn-glycerol-3-phosphate acyltransferase [Saprospiraceae bacterium]|uniref:1-acyl-sn-glycerol-3-phosphate acyltransferase n=1 Tax=Candidatus Opimibacter skivensis TaxID=2982028 RepID=A0A9D7SWF2_9BACT|nr:1-acyl-sn-glycerol-3-phosphate acyltransferase [Candidatus Opimibacter skivensis]
MKYLSRLILRILGWKVILEIPADLKKYVVAVAPHTSWKDFFLGLVVRSSIGRKIYYLGKKELFDSPFGFFFWWTGGRPVDRKQKTGLVDQVVALFNGSEEFAIGIAPEGTRKKVSDFKTGFYFIAQKAGVPIIPCSFDYGHKTVHFMKPFYPTSDSEKDLDLIWSYFDGVMGAKVEGSISGRWREVEI